MLTSVNMLSMKRIVILAVLLILAACSPSNEAPRPISESDQSYNTNERIPVDDTIYMISGEVFSDVESLIRQTEEASGSTFGYNGVISGYYTGPQFEGKGFIRVLVSNTEPESELAPIGAVVILKTTDTKAVALLGGDQVTFKCRAQYEPLAAVRDGETFNAETLETWELDYCRLVSPIVGRR